MGNLCVLLSTLDIYLLKFWFVGHTQVSAEVNEAESVLCMQAISNVITL